MDTEQIFQLITEFNNDELEGVLDGTLDYTVRDSHGDTFLHCAARVDNVNALQLLLTKGKSMIDEVDSGGASVLMTACAWGSLGVVDLLLTKYAFAFDMNEGMQADKTMPYTYLGRARRDGADDEWYGFKLELLFQMIALGAHSDSFMMEREIIEWQQADGKYYDKIVVAKQAYNEAAVDFVARIQPVDALNRFALRNAYFLLAKAEYARGDMTAAMEHLNVLFSIADLADDKPLFTAEQEELRVQVYKLAAQQNEEWLPYYKEVLQTIVDNNIPMADSTIYQDIADINVVASGQYTLPQNKAAVRVAGESLLDAFLRHRKVIENELEYTVSEPATAEELAAAASEIGFELPKDLVDFYTKVGNGFSDGRLIWCQGLDISRATGIVGFFESVQEWFGGDDFDFVEESEISAEDVEFVNSNYKVFATYYENEDSHYKFFFGKNGRFGISQFCQDGLEFNEQLLERDMPLLQYDDLDEMMSKFLQIQVNRYRCRQNMVNDAYWRLADDLAKVG
ncbi:ankyrin repeat domain-containing protein [Culicoidibacter larvae]|nr:ankyrin repeat domain-containing protein [Culicoidibacter larvae]